MCVSINFVGCVIPTVAQSLSALCFQPYLEDRFLIHDTCGVHNLHGMPAVIGTIISIIMAAKADTALYGKVATLEVHKKYKGLMAAAIERLLGCVRFPRSCHCEIDAT